MKILPIVPISALSLALVISPVCADIPASLKPRVDPKIEAVTADELLRLINDIRTEAGIEKLSQVESMHNAASALREAVVALAHLGRYEVALRYCAPYVWPEPEFNPNARQLREGEEWSEDEISAPEREETTPANLFPDADARTDIYKAAIYRKVVYGKRTEARALVSLIQQPEKRFVPLLWLAEAALRDNQRAEALVYLKEAHKVGGATAASHEWFGLLLARAGQRAGASQIFKTRQIELQKRRPEREERPDDRPSGDREEMFGNGWGGLCSAMWLAGFTDEAMTLLKAHPQGDATILQTVLSAKLTSQRRAALNTLRHLPEAVRGSAEYQYLAMLPVSRGPLSPELKKQIEWLENDSTKRITRWDKRDQEEEREFNPDREEALIKVVGAWQSVGQPARAKAFLKRPALKMNDSQSAYIEFRAMQTNLYVELYRMGGSQSWQPKVKLPLAQTRQFSQQIVARFNRFRYPEVAIYNFSRDSKDVVDFFLQMGDLTTAKAIVYAADQVFERNWKAASASDSKDSFISGFSNMADCFQKIGDTAASKKWKAHFDSLTRAVREAEPKNYQVRSVHYGRFSAYEQAQTAVESSTSPHALKAALAYPTSTRQLPIADRVEALPSYATSLSDRGSFPIYCIRDSGYWEFVE